MSDLDKLKRKKYTRVWRLDSKVITRLMIRFPSTVTRFMVKENHRKIGYNSGSSDKPNSKNSLTNARFCDSM
jgi:hypothetical protein